MQPAVNPKPLSPAEQLGALIRQHRVARDIDLHEVSDRVGVKLSRLREFENGDSVPEPREWARLCNMVHRGLRMHTLEFRAARAAVSSTHDAGIDVTKATNYMSQEPPLEDASNVPAVVDEIPRVEDALAFGEALRRARLIEGMSQDEFGNVIGVTGQAISAWERGEVMPLLSNFEKLVQLVPSTERWRGECLDREYTKGAKPEGFTTNGNPGPRDGSFPSDILKPAIDRVIAETQKQREPIVHLLVEPTKAPSLVALIEGYGGPTPAEAGAAYAAACVDVARAARALQQYEDCLVEPKRAVTIAEKRRAEAADVMSKAVNAAVFDA